MDHKANTGPKPVVTGILHNPLAASHPQVEAGGADGDQTHDLVVANDALYQLSYCPESREGQVLGNGRV